MNFSRLAAARRGRGVSTHCGYHRVYRCRLKSALVRETTPPCWLSMMRWRRQWTCSLRGCTSGVTGQARDVGRKAVAVNVADIEAVGARATGLLVGFSAPADLPLGWVLDFAEGIRHESHAAGGALLGGDVTRARDILSHCGHRLGVTGGS